MKIFGYIPRSHHSHPRHGPWIFGTLETPHMIGIPHWRLYPEDLGDSNVLGHCLSNYAQIPFAGYQSSGRSTLDGRQGVLKA